MFMSPSRLVVGVVVCLIAGTPGRCQEWRPSPAPLKTRWAQDVSPENARTEYPRPQLVRSDWKNLNGLWEFDFADSAFAQPAELLAGKKLSRRILVPWTFEASLSGLGKGQEVHEHVAYRRLFDVPASWAGKRVLLHFGAVDWESRVWINGREMGVHRGGYTPFSFDITEALKPSGSQELVIAVYDPADPKKGAFQPKGKQLGSHSIWYTRTTGIWQTVWLEPVPQAHIANLDIEADLATATVMISAKVNGRAERVTARISLSGRTVADFSATVDKKSVTTLVSIKDPQPWHPDSPILYDIHVTLLADGKEIDRVQSYTGFRTVSLKDKRICLNGRPYFLRGVLDQGFWPDGIYTPPNDQAIKNEVVMTKAFGLNLARKHVKVEDPRWYYYCDKLGLLVAQDMPSSHNLQSSHAKENFEEEWHEVMNTLRNHPSIILWIPFNENWGDPKEFQDHIVNVTRAADRRRPIIDASGWTQREKTDITDIHDYGNDLKKHAKTDYRRPAWIGEYGGIALPVAGHTWVKGWGYQVVKTPDELLQKYKFLTDQINEAPGLSGFVYTQLTDVEQELNGLMTYDRLPKAPPEKFAAINLRR
jgi:beta-galactosidase/beta-glucuronidase